MARRNCSSPDDMKMIFSKFDKNGDGKISSDEVIESLDDLGVKVTSQEVQSMMQNYDEDGDGYIDIEEFAGLYKDCGLDGSGGNDGASNEADLKDAFDLFDLDKNGLISVRELHSVLNQIKEKSSLSDCVNMIRAFDQDGDGHVNFEEFKKMMSLK